MTPASLKAWREHLGLNKQDAAKALGLSINGYAAYERGHVAYTEKRGLINFRAEAPRRIPRYVALACAAIEAGLTIQA